MKQHIQVKDLFYRYPKSDFALRIENFHVAAGEKVALTGSSGSGKTTAIRLIANFISPESGHIEILGKTLAKIKKAEERAFRSTEIGFVFQQLELVEYLSVLDNIRLPFLINSKHSIPQDLRGKVESLAESLGIEDKLSSRPGCLSQGQQQRVAIARAMITNPKIIIADEPTGNLDTENAEAIVKLLCAQSDKYNASLLMVTHQKNLLSLFDRSVDTRDWGGI